MDKEGKAEQRTKWCKLTKEEVCIMFRIETGSGWIGDTARLLDMCSKCN
jgi:hypothetical protein